VAGEEVALPLAVSSCSGRDVSKGRIRYAGPGFSGTLEQAGHVLTRPLSFRAPHAAGPRSYDLRVLLESEDRHLWAENSFVFHVLPRLRPVRQRLCVGPALAEKRRFAASLRTRGYTLVEDGAAADVTIWQGLDYERAGRLSKGGRALILIEAESDLPVSAGLKLEKRADPGDVFLWFRADCLLFTGVTRRWIGGPGMIRLAGSLSIEGIDTKGFGDVLAACLCSQGSFFRPQVCAFRLGHGTGILCAMPLRQLYEEGDPLGQRLFDCAIAALRPGGMPPPRFSPELSPATVFVASSRQGSALWQVASTAPRTSWHLPGFDDGAWLRSRGAFGRRGAPGLTLRHTWETPDIYARTRFRVDRFPRLLRMELFHDRNIEVAINGRTVLRREGYTTDSITIDLPFDPRSVLQIGENLLAVHCHQDRTSHNLDVGLVGIY